MAGIYIHIPFCEKACSYCDFHFSTSLALQDKLTLALCREIEMRKTELSTPINSIYFGGGSPSVISSKNLEQIFDTLRSCFDLSRLQEVTLESNPNDHTAEKLVLWKTLGIDRLSIGIQSFHERDLTLMNRSHNASQARSCVENARKAGFDNMTIDLIYGIPNQSFEEWQNNVQSAINLNVDHISAYCLTVEPKTLLAHHISQGELIEKSDEIIEAEYLLLHKSLDDVGYEHYEISNYSKPNHQAIHNQNYWSGSIYLGFGPSAHSFDGSNRRRWNVSNNAQYIKAINNNLSYCEHEDLSDRERTNENIMTQLRTKTGMELSNLSLEELESIKQSFHGMDASNKAMMEFTDKHLRIKAEHWLMSDHLIRSLILI